jgi:ankyrin repeat protein
MLGTEYSPSTSHFDVLSRESLPDEIFSLEIDLRRTRSVWAGPRGFTRILPLHGLLMTFLVSGNHPTSQRPKELPPKGETDRFPPSCDLVSDLESDNGQPAHRSFHVRDVSLLLGISKMLALIEADTLGVEVTERCGRDSFGIHHCYHRPSPQWFDSADGENGTSVASLFDPEEEEVRSLTSFCSAAQREPNFMAPPYTAGDDPLGRAKNLIYRTVGVPLVQRDWTIALCDHPQHYPEEDEVAGFEHSASLTLPGAGQRQPRCEPELVGEGYPFAAGLSANIVAYETLWERKDRLHFLAGCCAGDNVDCVRFAMRSDGSDSCLMDRTRLGLNILMVAAEWGAAKVFKLLISICPPSMLKASHPGTGQVVLHYACRGGNLDVLRRVLHDHKADPNVPSAKAWITPLHVACQNVDVAAVDLLLSAGADFTATARTGSSALHFLSSAQRLGQTTSTRTAETPTNDVEAAQIAIVASLVSYAEVGVAAADELNPSRRSVVAAPHSRLPSSSPIDVATLRVKEYLSSQTEHGLTPLHIALRWDRVELGIQLIRLGANVKAKDMNGNRPLHMAVMYCRDAKVGPLIRALLENGAKPAAKNCVGRTAIDVAREMNRLGEHQALRTFNQIAMERGHHECVVS